LTNHHDASPGCGHTDARLPRGWRSGHDGQPASARPRPENAMSGFNVPPPAHIFAGAIRPCINREVPAGNVPIWPIPLGASLPATSPPRRPPRVTPGWNTFRECSVGAPLWDPLWDPPLWEPAVGPSLWEPPLGTPSGTPRLGTPLWIPLWDAPGGMARSRNVVWGTPLEPASPRGNASPVQCARGQPVSLRFTAAARPLACCSISNASLCPSFSVRIPAFWTALIWTKMSLPPASGPMKP
jgi:hypothetical protein